MGTRGVTPLAEISYEKSENSGHMTRVSGTLGKKLGYDNKVLKIVNWIC